MAGDRAFERRMGARLRAARVGSGMSQVQIADAVGVSHTQIQKFERGVDRATGATIQALAHAIGVSVATFFDDPPRAEIDPDRGEVLKMTATLMRLPPSLQSCLMQLAAELASRRRGPDAPAQCVRALAAAAEKRPQTRAST